MEPVGQWPVYASSYNRLSSAAAGGDSHLSAISGNSSTLPHGRAAPLPPSTTSPQLLLQAASPATATPFAPTVLLPSTPLAYNSVLFNQQSMYQDISTFNTNNGHYHHSVATAVSASNPYYDNHRNSVLMDQPTIESISPQLGSQLQNTYGHVGPEVVTHSPLLSKSNSAHYDNFSNNLFGTTALDSQSINFSYNDKNSNLQQCGVSMNVQNVNSYSNIPHPYEVPNTGVHNNPYNVHQTSKKSVIVTPVTLSPSSLSLSPFPHSPLSMSETLPASVKVKDQHHDHVQHQKDQTMTLNLINSKQLHPSSSPASSHHTFDIHSKFSNSLPQPINNMNLKEFKSTELASKVQSSSNVPHSQSPNNNLYEQSSKTPAHHGSYQHIVMNKNQHQVYNSQILESLSESSSPSSSQTFSVGGLSTHNTNFSSSAAPPDLTAFDRQTSPSLPSSPGYEMPPYKDAKYATSPQQGFLKGRSGDIGAYSPCIRREQGPVMCAVTSPLNTQFQTSPRHVNSPSYPSHCSPVNLSSASQPTSKLPNLLDGSTLLGGSGEHLNKTSQLSSSHANISETNFNELTHLNQQSYWQDSNHNLHKANFNYSDHSLSSNSGKCFEGNSFKKSDTDDSSLYLHPRLNEEMLMPNSDPISSIKNVTNNIQEKTNYLPNDVFTFNLPQTKDQRNSTQSQQTGLQSKNSMEQKVSNNESNPFQRSSTGKISSNDGTRFNNDAAACFQNPADYISTVLPLPNDSLSLSQNTRSSNLNQISQGNSPQQTITYGDSNSYNSSAFDENNAIRMINATNVIKNVSHSPLKMHSPHDSNTKQQKKNKLNAFNKDAMHVTKEICSNTSTHPTAENYVLDSTQQVLLNDDGAKSSINESFCDKSATSTLNSSIKTSPFHNVNQSLMVSQFPSSNQTPPNDMLVPQTRPLNDSQIPLAKLSSISISTEKSSHCSSTIGKKNDETRVVVPSVEEELNFLFDPVDTFPVVPHNHNQKQKSTRRGRPPKIKDFQVAKMPEKKPLSFPPAINNGFMASYIKFLEDIQYDSPDNVVPPPRRELSTRKAKQKSSIKRILNDDYEDADEYNSINSDSDPAWSPAAMKDDSDEDFDIGRRTRSRSVRGSGQRGRKRGRQSNVTEISSDDDDDRRASKHKRYATRTKSDDKSNDSDVIITDSTETNATKKESDAFPFQIGEFVINKTEVNLENPPIWRVDGKTLLQKYEPSEQKGEIVYKNIPTYAGWTHLNNDAFERVQVKIKQQNRNETIVQLLAQETKISEEEQKAIDKFIEETVKYQDNFEIYIQTLISQALDSNFLAEIIQENDEYFLDNVKAIDNVTLERRKKLIDYANWQDSVVEKSMATWPCIDVLPGAPKADVNSEKCASCKTDPVTKRVIAYGQPYNNENLEGCPPNPAIGDHKDFLLCKNCIQVVTLYNKIVHQKYLMFIQCANKVQEKRTSDPTKDTTIILNELLADEQWLAQLFKEVRTNWAQVERFIINNDDVQATPELPI